jgi:hypothetical protein
MRKLLLASRVGFAHAHAHTQRDVTVELGTELDRGGAATDDNKVEEASALGLRGRGTAGALKALDDPLPDVARVGHRLEEIAVLLNAGHPVERESDVHGCVRPTSEVWPHRTR